MRTRSIVNSVREIVTGGPWVHRDFDAKTPPDGVVFGLSGSWYYDLRQSLVRDDYSPFDDSGIPVRGTGRESGQRPVLALSYGLAHLAGWLLDQDAHSEGEALRIGRWLCREVLDSPVDGAIVVRVPIRGLLAPWPNALAQGLALSLLTRLHEVAPAAGWQQATEAAVRPFDRSVGQGGLRDVTNSCTWFEEYPFPTGGSHVLNGFVYALWGLRDASLAGFEVAGRLYEEGLDSLVRLLPRYSGAGWSFYDYPDWGQPRVASFYNQRTHAGLFRAFAKVAPQHDELFSGFAAECDLQADRLVLRARALLAKRSDRTLRAPTEQKAVKAASDVQP